MIDNDADVSRPTARPSRRQLLTGAGVVAAGGAAGAFGMALPAEAAVTPAHSRPHGPKQPFVSVRGHDFRLHGRRWRWGGTNCYYLHTQSHYMIDSILNNAKAMGMAVVRAWAFNDGDAEGALQSAPYVYEEKNFDSLDYAVYKAGQLGIRLVLPLVNNWPDYGGMPQYVKWFLNLEDDVYGVAVNHDRFYTDRAIRTCYQAYVRHVIGRRNRYTGMHYRDDPTIMTWELANEPRNRSDQSGNAVLDWANHMSKVIKRAAPHQLVAIGDEGMGLREGDADYAYSTYEGNHWLKLSALEAVDYGTFHLYPQSWNQNAAPISWGTSWIQDHLKLGRSTLQKPVVLEEFGLKVAASTTVGDEATREQGYDAWLNAFEKADGAATQFWLLTALTDAGVNYEDYDGFRVTYPSELATLLSAHAAALAKTV